MVGSDRVNLSPQYNRQKQMSNISACTPQVEHNSRTLKRSSPLWSSALVLGTLDYTKREDQVYHTMQNEGHNTDECSSWV